MQNAAADCTVQQLSAAVVCICLHDQIQQSHCGFNPAAKTFPSGPKRVTEERFKVRARAKHVKVVPLKGKSRWCIGRFCGFEKIESFIQAFCHSFNLYILVSRALWERSRWRWTEQPDNKRGVFTLHPSWPRSPGGAKMTIDRPSCW